MPSTAGLGVWCSVGVMSEAGFVHSWSGGDARLHTWRVTLRQVEHPDGTPLEQCRVEGPFVRSHVLATRSAANDWLRRESGLTMHDLRADLAPRDITGPAVSDDVD